MMQHRASWVCGLENCWSNGEPETSLRRSVKVALHGKNILTTRAASNSGDLGQRLTELGAHVVEFPTVEMEPVEDWAAIDDAIVRMNSYHWLMFTSANAIDYFMKRIGAD